MAIKSFHKYSSKIFFNETVEVCKLKKSLQTYIYIYIHIFLFIILCFIITLKSLPELIYQHLIILCRTTKIMIDISVFHFPFRVQNRNQDRCNFSTWIKVNFTGNNERKIILKFFPKIVDSLQTNYLYPKNYPESSKSPPYDDKIANLVWQHWLRTTIFQ